MKKQEKEVDYKYTKEASAMETAIKLQASDRGIISGMANYTKKLKSQPRDVAQKEAREALIRTGVTTRNGKTKKTIVSWE